MDTHDSAIENRQNNLLKTILDLFCGMKTVVVLLLALAFVSVLGTLIKQNASPEEYKAIYGPDKYAIIKLLSLDNLYDAWYYKAILSIVGISLFACSISRFKKIWKRTFEPCAATDKDTISRMQDSRTVEVASRVTDIEDDLNTVLSNNRYHISAQHESNDSMIFAAKGRLNLWGSYITHVSLLVIFIGAIFGNRMGFTGFTAIQEGGSTSSYTETSSMENKDLGFRVGLHKFEIVCDADNNPVSYKSYLEVSDKNTTSFKKTIDVNHPLTYRGISFHQNDFGLSSLRLKISGRDGQSQYLVFDIETYPTHNGKAYEISGEPFKQVKINNKLTTVFIHNLAANYTDQPGSHNSDLPLNPAVNVMVNDRLPAYKGLDAWKKLGWLEIGKSATYGGSIVSLDDVTKYTDLQVSENPGLPVIYAGFALLLTGVFISFYVRYSVIRIIITTNTNTATVMLGASSEGELSILDSEFAGAENSPN